MYPRTNYEMTQNDLDVILAACKRVPFIMVGGYTPSSPQENANRAWEFLGEKMGFDHMTVQPISGKGNRFFTAVPSETEEARLERLEREENDAKKLRVTQIKNDIANLQKTLAELQPHPTEE